MGVAGLVVARRGRRLHEAEGEKRATWSKEDAAGGEGAGGE